MAEGCESLTATAWNLGARSIHAYVLNMTESRSSCHNRTRLSVLHIVDGGGQGHRRNFVNEMCVGNQPPPPALLFSPFFLFYFIYLFIFPFFFWKQASKCKIITNGGPESVFHPRARKTERLQWASTLMRVSLDSQRLQGTPDDSGQGPAEVARRPTRGRWALGVGHAGQRGPTPPPWWMGSSGTGS